MQAFFYNFFIFFYSGFFGKFFILLTKSLFPTKVSCGEPDEVRLRNRPYAYDPLNLLDNASVGSDMDFISDHCDRWRMPAVFSFDRKSPGHELTGDREALNCGDILSICPSKACSANRSSKPRTAEATRDPTLLSSLVLPPRRRGLFPEILPEYPTSF